MVSTSSTIFLANHGEVWALHVDVPTCPSDHWPLSAIIKGASLCFLLICFPICVAAQPAFGPLAPPGFHVLRDLKRSILSLENSGLEFDSYRSSIRTFLPLLT